MFLHAQLSCHTLGGKCWQGTVPEVTVDEAECFVVPVSKIARSSGAETAIVAALAQTGSSMLSNPEYPHQSCVAHTHGSDPESRQRPAASEDWLKELRQYQIFGNSSGIASLQQNISELHDVIEGFQAAAFGTA